MMVYKLILIHTVLPLIQVFNRLAQNLTPEIKLIHILDEILLEFEELNAGSMEIIEQRLQNHILNAQQVHAAAVLATCSILSEPINKLRATAKIPLIKIDEEMARIAVNSGKKIGVLATNANTLKPSSQIIQNQATQLQKEILIIPAYVPNAFNAIRNGDYETHNRLVKQGIIELAPKVDLIVLAQASMAGVLFQLADNEKSVPILASPQIALEEAYRTMKTSGRLVTQQTRPAT